MVLNSKGAKGNLPNEISMEGAIRMNEESGRLDLIQEIKSDGTVVFTEYACQIVKETLGFDCQSVKYDDSKDLAYEQIAFFKELVKN